MDPESARMVRDSIVKLRSADRAIIFCTHNLEEAEELADQVAIIRRGWIIAAGKKNALKESALGPPEYEARFSRPIEGGVEDLPRFATISCRGVDRLRFKVDDPTRNNPELLGWLLARGLPVIAFQAVPQNLEEVYMQAMQQADHGS
jgi:ABC-2 type transport system ATP-binding protein